MSGIRSCSRNINKGGKKRESLVQNRYLNLPDLQFFYWCNEQFSVNRGVYNTIDQWFYEYGMNEVILRRMYILSFLRFVREAGLKAEEQKFIRFGNGGLINQLTKFIKSIEAKS
jgi:riboflavin kinase